MNSNILLPAFFNFLPFRIHKFGFITKQPLKSLHLFHTNRGKLQI